MGKTKETGFGGFNSIFDSLSQNNNKEIIPNLTPDSNIKDDSEEPVDLSLGKTSKNKADNIDPDSAENPGKEGFFDSMEEVDLEEELKSKNNKSTKKDEQTTNVGDEDESTETGDETDENETSNVTDFFDAFAESLGWEIDEDEKPKSVEELVQYVQRTVEENSKPQYATSEIEDLNEFVKNGGDLADYISMSNQISDYKNLDITDENNQKQIVREYLQHTGLNDTQINRKISKYEDAGLLEDEAEEALEYMQEVKAEEQKQLLVQQQKQAEAYKAEQQKFYTNVVSEIENLKDIRGINIPKEDKKVLRDYLFKVEGDGKTKYQKDYSKSVKNLIESAYFTMKGDTLITAAKKTGETSAVKNLKNKLSSTKVGSSKHSMEDGAATPVWAISSFLRKPTN